MKDKSRGAFCAVLLTALALLATSSRAVDADKQRVAQKQPEGALSAGGDEAAEKARRDEQHWREMASAFISAKKYDLAIRLYRYLLKRHPEDVDTWLGLAHAGGQGGDHKLALEALAQAEHRKPSVAQLRRMMLLYQDVEEYSRSRNIADDLIRRFPETAGYYRDRGIINYRSGDKAAALEDFQKALKLQPGLLSASSSLAALYIEQGRLREALDVYDKALKAQPEPDEKLLASSMDRERLELRARIEKENR